MSSHRPDRVGEKSPKGAVQATVEFPAVRREYQIGTPFFVMGPFNFPLKWRFPEIWRGTT
jgi:hypothetical protein